MTPANTETEERPLEVLRRRYAEGKLSTEEYEERKARLEQGRVPSRPPNGTGRGRGCCMQPPRRSPSNWT